MAEARAPTGPAVDAVVVSERRLWDLPWTAYCVELEAVLADLLGADTVEVERADGRLASALSTRFRLRNAAARCAALRPFVWEVRDERYDLAVVVVNDLRQLGVLAAIPTWRRLAHTFVAYVFEIWPAWLAAAAPVVSDVVDRLDHVFVGIRSGAEALRTTTSTPVTFLPPAVDALAVDPVTTAEDRRIDVSNRGRRDHHQHEVLRAWAARTGAFYEFDTLHDGLVADPIEHRRHYYEQTARSRAFVANPARFDLPELSGGVREVGLRYLEALACGTVLLGDHPHGSACRRLLGDPPGMVDLPAGAGSLGADVEELLADVAATHELGLANRARALAHHDVLHRWEVMADALGIGRSTGAVDRQAALDAAAVALRSARVDQPLPATARCSTAR